MLSSGASSMTLVGVLALTCDGCSTSGGVGHWLDDRFSASLDSGRWLFGCSCEGGGVKPLSDHRADRVLG